MNDLAELLGMSREDQIRNVARIDENRLSEEDLVILKSFVVDDIIHDKLTRMAIVLKIVELPSTTRDDLCDFLAAGNIFNEDGPMAFLQSYRTAGGAATLINQMNQHGEGGGMIAMAQLRNCINQLLLPVSNDREYLRIMLGGSDGL